MTDPILRLTLIHSPCEEEFNLDKIKIGIIRFEVMCRFIRQ
jgi:hypothetical protein